MSRLLAILVVLGGLGVDAGVAAEAPVCAGRDRSGDAELKPDWAAHADDLVNGDGLLWKLEKPGLSPSYLFGTIHSTAPGPIALALAAKPLIEQSQGFASELGLLDTAKKVEISAAMLQAALSPDQDTIAGALSPVDAAVVDGFLARKGLSRELAHHLKLWMLAVMASLPACEAEGQARGLPEVDEMLAEFALARKIPVVALETVPEQLRALSDAPPAVSAAMLEAAARAPALEDDSYKTLLSLYEQKRPSAAIAILDAVPGLSPREREAETAFTRLLLNGRNETMIERAAPLLAQGGAFVAVGSLHLIGKDGLVELARRRGYAVSKVW